MDGKIFLCTALIREAHELKAFAHAGQNKTLQLLKKEYYWQGRNNNIKRYIKNCRDYQRNKTRHDKTPGLLHPLLIPKRVWEHVMVDGKSMPKNDKGYDYVWAFVCQFKKKALEIVKQNQKVQELAQQNAVAAHALIETQANKKHQSVDFTVSDIVYVSKKGFLTEAPTMKLDSQNAGPWTIMEKRGHSFILDTPPWYKGSKLFHANRLWKVAQNLLPQQQLEPEPPVEINREPE
ncbi:Uu.00g056830.m01.CDS01 [Anthostomella pinea]|uniref:Uu.00g056830.m01.CDS01 n=1 Tax=Anthostomella pinea TaxID=933095 RepID=A0AAI8YLZ8_9PEZI|nr:Uu.00g056830.m01.CDS01 [Anthostomella pinea]